MKRFFALALVVAMVGLGVPMPASAANAGQISGAAFTSDMHALGGMTARLRSLATGVVRDTTTLSAQGAFAFSGLSTGSYMIEVVKNGRVVGTSGEVAITAASPVAAGVKVFAASSQDQATQAAAAGGSFWGSTAGILTIVAIGAGVTTAVVVSTRNTSPSK